MNKKLIKYKNLKINSEWNNERLYIFMIYEKLIKRIKFMRINYD